MDARTNLGIIIDHSSMTPFYEQIALRLRAAIIDGVLQAGDLLPSVRSLAADLQVSALTVKKAYDKLESEYLMSSVHGKGTFVRAVSLELISEENRRRLESDLSELFQRARQSGISGAELREIIELLLEEEK